MNFDDVSALGERLAATLDEHDFLGRWTAQYVAEVLAKAELEVGQARDDARREAFDVILKLWHHRQHLPVIRPPLSQFDNVFATLDRLAGDSPWGYSGLFKDLDAPTSDRTEEIDLLAVACLIDMKARDAVRLAVALAGEYAAEGEESWTAVAQGILDEEFQRAIRRSRGLSRDPRQSLTGWPEATAEDADAIEPIAVIKRRLTEVIDSLSEILQSAKRNLEDGEI